MVTQSTGTGTNKISTFVLAAIYITLILSVAAIVWAVFAYYQNEPIELTLYLLVIGFLAMGLSGYILFQSRKRVAAMKVESPPILTTIECRKCNIKNVREFERGDYVYKELGPCEKCENEQKIITAIYREVKEKEKPINV